MDDNNSLERIKKICLSTMKCSRCQNFLSVVSKDGGRLRCKRCKGVPGKTLSRSSAFMEIAQEFSLPCTHEGCEALVPWNDVRKHEEMCNERSVKCPFNNLECGCVKMKELVEHLQNKHQCNVFFDTVTHNLDPTINQVISVVIFKNHIFFLLTKSDPNFEILLIMLNDSENTGMSFTYNVRLSRESNDSIFLHKNQQIFSLGEGEYCFACWLKKCSVHSDNKGICHPFDVVIRGLDFSCLKQLFGIESAGGIKYSIEIVALQKITQELSVPCNYEGCKALVPWNEVQKHEEICDEKFFRCPFKNFECGFVKMKGLVEHLENIHECNVFFDTPTHNLDDTTTEIISVVTFKNHIFFVLTRGDPNFNILIIMLNNNKNTDMSFTYNVRLSNKSNDKIVYLFENQQIDLLEEGTYCFDCWLNRCSIHDRGCELLKNVSIKKINLSHIKTSFGLNRSSGGIKYSVEIVPVENPLKIKEPAADGPSIQTNNLRNMLQCPVCMEYMIGHIFSCENGHVLCHTCKTLVTTCPTCRVTLGILRCIPLENLADLVLLDCSFAEKGCNFSGKVKILFQHEKECNYKARPPPSRTIVGTRGRRRGNLRRTDFW